MFCMLLRKHLVGARVAELRQPKMERLVELELDITDEFGRPGRRWLVLEAMGRHSNLILLDGERRIIDCMRRVDADMSASRQVLPGLFYELPPTHGKRYLTDVTEEALKTALSAANPEGRVDAFLLDNFFGLSPLVARELALEAAGATDARLFQTEEERLWRCLERLLCRIREGEFTPVCLTQEGRMLEFSYLPIAQYGAMAERRTYPDFSTLMDDFYEARERQERLRQRGADLLRTATTARDRVRRKLALQERDYTATQDRDQLRICGDLITANLYRMERGQRKLVAENFYDESGGEITVVLDPLLTPQQNAAQYYKRYTKAKTAEVWLRRQMEAARQDLQYLESVLEELQRAETETDFNDIRGELREAGFLRGQGKDKREKPSRPRRFRTSAGLTVLVGRSNRQNDRLTREADRRDLWFHTQKIHGSHVILQTGGREPDQDSIVEAAKLAAWFSQARESGNVPVDYVQVKYVKKPAGARPGMVVYTGHRTVNVTPEESLVKRLMVR